MKRVRQYLCNKSSDSFCYVCGLFVPISDRRQISDKLKLLYLQYFGMEVRNQEFCWVPHVACSTCRRGLERWSQNKEHLKFGVPMIWRDPINHQTNCYICLTNIVGFSARNRHRVTYANVSSVTLPVPHSQDIPIPPSPVMPAPNFWEDEDDDVDDVCHVEDRPERDPLYIPDTEQPHPLTQGDLNDLVRDLNLSKSGSELLASRLQQWSLLARGSYFNIFYTHIFKFEEYF